MENDGEAAETETTDTQDAAEGTTNEVVKPFLKAKSEDPFQ